MFSGRGLCVFVAAIVTQSQADHHISTKCTIQYFCHSSSDGPGAHALSARSYKYCGQGIERNTRYSLCCSSDYLRCATLICLKEYSLHFTPLAFQQNKEDELTHPSMLQDLIFSELHSKKTTQAHMISR